MSTAKKNNAKDLSFSKADKRVLTKYLEKYYATELLQYRLFDDILHKDANKTKKANIDRRFRLKIKPIELVLHAIGSEFMSNVETPSIRKTLTIAARTNGAVQSKGAIVGNLRVIRDKRSR